MAYVDLNPVRAGLAERIEACADTSIAERLQDNSAEALAAYLAPVVSGLDAGDDGGEIQAAPDQAPSGGKPASGRVPAAGAPNRPLPYPSISQREYVGMVRAMAEATVAPAARRPGRVAEWLARTAVLGKRQRAYGPKGRRADWIERRSLQLREAPLPA